MSYADQLMSQVQRKVDTTQWKSLHWEGPFRAYLDLLWDKPEFARNAWQRLYDLILSYGFDEYTEFKERRTRYRFFADPDGEGKDAVFGLEDALMRLVDTVKAGAHGFGPERRIILLHGPVGSAKSTIARLLKRGLERYSRRPEGALYTFSWVLEDGTLAPSPMNEEPLLLDPDRRARRDRARSSTSASTARYRISIPGDLDPMSRWYFNHFLKKYEGDWTSVLDHVRVRRLAALREGPRRHRHVPAEGREEPGLDRAHRRHQLPQDRRVRLATPTRARSTSTASSTSPTAG